MSEETIHAPTDSHLAVGVVSSIRRRDARAQRHRSCRQSPQASFTVRIRVFTRTVVPTSRRRPEEARPGCVETFALSYATGALTTTITSWRVVVRFGS